MIWIHNPYCLVTLSCVTFVCAVCPPYTLEGGTTFRRREEVDLKGPLVPRRLAPLWSTGVTGGRGAVGGRKFGPHREIEGIGFIFGMLLWNYLKIVIFMIMMEN